MSDDNSTDEDEPTYPPRDRTPLTGADFDCESIRLKDVINTARGVGPKDWPLPPHSSWDRCWRDIKDAVDRRELPTSMRDPRIRHRTVQLNDLWTFVIARPAKRWDWLREFCRQWAAGQGAILSEAPADGESEQAPQKVKSKTPKRTRGYFKKDAPLLEQMHQMIESKEADNVPYAADAVAKNAVGKGTFASKSKRLEQGYMRKYRR